MIGIIDYGMGNLHSVENALHKLGQDSIISADSKELHACEKLILPGVGAFPDCMQNIHRQNLYSFIQQEVQSGKPLLGICLGMQMLFERSYEKGITEGFGFLKGEVRYMEDPTVPIPEIGWNELIFDQDTPLKELLSEHPFVYYVHSYYATNLNEDTLVAHSEYGHVIVPGIVQKNNVIGCQFHPEKSSTDGLKILKYYAEVFK